MAEIQAGVDFGFKSGTEAYKTGVDLQNYREQRKAQTNLLSSQAEEQRGLIQEKQQARINKLAGQASLAKTSEDLKLDLNNAEDAVKIYNTAIAATVEPGLRESLFKDKAVHLERLAGISTNMSKVGTEEKEQFLENIMPTMSMSSEEAGRTLREQASTEKNPKTANRYKGLAAIYEGTAPVPRSRLTPDSPDRAWNQLSAAEQKEFNAELIRNSSSVKDRTALEVQQQIQANAKIAETERNNRERALIAAQIAATARDKLLVEADLKASKDTLEKEKLILKHEQEINKLITNGLEEVPNPEYEKLSWYEINTKNIPEKITNPRITVLQAAIDKLNGITPDEKVSEYTPEQEAWLAAAMKANPNMPRDEVIAHGKKLKKL